MDLGTKSTAIPTRLRSLSFVALSLRALSISSAGAALILLLYPQLQSAITRLSSAAQQASQSKGTLLLVLISILAALVALGLQNIPKLWKSFRAGLILPNYHLSIIALTTSEVLIGRHRFDLAATVLAAAGCLSYSTKIARRSALVHSKPQDPIDPDL